MEKLTATISEISAEISSNAHSAAEVNNHMHTVGQGAEESNQPDEWMLKAMADIKTASDQIDRIIRTIEDIAPQTNILALNAVQHGTGIADESAAVSAVRGGRRESGQ